MGMGEQDTRYAKSGDVHLAYQVTGDVPVDVVIFRDSSHMSNCAGGNPRSRDSSGNWGHSPN